MTLQHSLLPVPLDSSETLPSDPARDLTNTDIRRIQASLHHSVSENIRKMYVYA